MDTSVTPGMRLRRQHLDTPVDIANKPYVISVNYAGGGMRSSANQEIYVNGTKKYGLTVSGSSSAAASLPIRPDISIGSDLTGSNAHNGHIAEVVVYDENYLTLKDKLLRLIFPKMARRIL